MSPVLIMASRFMKRCGVICVGTKRVYTAAEVVLWDTLFGLSYTAYVAGLVCSGQGPANHGGIARLAKEARAIRLAHVTATSLKVFVARVREVAGAREKGQSRRVGQGGRRGLGGARGGSAREPRDGAGRFQ